MTTSTGRPLEARNVLRQFNSLCAAVGIDPKPFTYYDAPRPPEVDVPELLGTVQRTAEVSEVEPRSAPNEGASESNEHLESPSIGVGDDDKCFHGTGVETAWFRVETWDSTVRHVADAASGA